MKTAGYSKTPLWKKLGFKKGFLIKLINEPAGYMQLVEGMPGHIVFNKKNIAENNLIHFFTKDGAELFRRLPELKKEIFQNGMISALR